MRWGASGPSRPRRERRRQVVRAPLPVSVCHRPVSHCSCPVSSTKTAPGAVCAASLNAARCLAHRWGRSAASRKKRGARTCRSPAFKAGTGPPPGGSSRVYRARGLSRSGPTTITRASGAWARTASAARSSSVRPPTRNPGLSAPPILWAAPPARITASRGGGPLRALVAPRWCAPVWCSALDTDHLAQVCDDLHQVGLCFDDRLQVLVGTGDLVHDPDVLTAFHATGLGEQVPARERLAGLG